MKRPNVNIQLVFVTFIGCILAFSSLHAATLLEINTSGSTGNEVSLPVTFTAVNVLGVDLTRGIGVSASNAMSNFGASGWNDLGSDDYFQFGLSVEAGF